MHIYHTCTYTCISCICKCLWRPEDGTESPEARITLGCELRTELRSSGKAVNSRGAICPDAKFYVSPLDCKFVYILQCLKKYLANYSQFLCIVNVFLNVSPI